MKKKKRVVIICLLLLICAVIVLPRPLSNVSAYNGTPYDTYTLGPKQYWIRTQTAFRTEEIYKPDISGAQDFFYDDTDNSLYIADTGNKRIAIYDADSFNLTGEIKDEDFISKPIGVYVRHGKIYVADSGSELVLIYDIEGLGLLQTIGRPAELIFGADEKYVPSKLCVDVGGNIYVTSEGSINGLIQFSADGELLGFTGVNQTPSSFMSAVRDFFFSDAQREQFFKKTPPSPTYVTVGENNLLYTVTNQAADGAVKKLNTSGSVIMTPSFNFTDTICAAVSDGENIYTVESNGWINIFDSYGEMLFSFGPEFSNADISGVVRKPSAITLKGKNFMVLDKEFNLIVEYKPTDFANLVFEAVAYYKEGYYVEGMDLWNKVLEQNSQFILSYKALAKANMKLGNYSLALSQFKLAEDKAGYSDAFWQVRNEWIQKNLGWLILIIVLIAAAIVAVQQVKKRTRLFAPVGNFSKRVKKIKFFQDFGFIKTYLRHPVNSCYRIKRRGNGSVIAATLLFLSITLTQILGKYAASYLFEVSFSGIGSVILYTLLPVALFVVANYFVSTISGGEGSLKNIYISSAYAIAPFILGMLPLYLLTNILTYNESFIYSVLSGAIIIYAAVMLFLNIKHIHNFSVGKTIWNILLTLFTIALFLLFVFIIYMLVVQEWGVLAALISEIFI